MPVLARFLLNFRIPLMIITLLITIFLGLKAPQFSLNNSVEVWFLDDDPALESYIEFQEIFGNDEIVIVSYRDDSLFTPEGLKKLKKTDQILSELDDVKKVISLASIDDIKDTADELRVDPMLMNLPETQEEADNFRDKAYNTPSIPGQVIDNDSHTPVLLVQLENIENMDDRRADILKTLKTALVKALDDEEAFHLGGIGVVYDALNRISMQDSMIFITLSDIVLAIFLWFTLKSIIAVVLALTVVGASVTCLIGIHNILGYQVNMVTAALPTLVMIIGIADSIHIIATYYRKKAESPEKDKDSVIIDTISGIAVPCLFTSITTAIGFGSLMAARMRVIRDLGLFACIGVVLAWYFSMAFSTWTFKYFDVSPKSDKGTPLWLSKLLSGISSLVVQKRRMILLMSVILFAVSIFGISRLDVDTFSINFLHKSDPCRQDSDWIEENFGFYMPLEFIVETAEGEARDPEILKAVEKFQQELEKHPDVSRVLSLTDMIKQTNRALYQEEEGSWKIPESRALLAQQMMLLEMDSDNNLDRFLDMSDSRIRITSQIRMMSARGIEKVVNHAISIAEKVLPEDKVTFTPTGYMGLYVKMISYVVHGQVVSFALAFLLVFIMMGLLFKSWKIAVLAIPPNTLPVIMTLGFMGYAGISLDVATVMVAGIALGIAVDDTIHLLHHYNLLRREGANPDQAAAGAVKTAGTAVVSTSIILFFGFMVLTMASIKSIVFLGLLTAVTMITALIGDLILLPALLSAFPCFGWDAKAEGPEDSKEDS